MEDWHKFLGDAALTAAILERLLHRSVLAEFRGKSYRNKEAATCLAKGNSYTKSGAAPISIARCARAMY